MFKARPSDVRALVRHLEKKHDAKVVTKNDTAEIKAVADDLRLLGIKNPAWFLDNFSFTLGRYVVLSFEPGETGKGAIPLYVQIAVICHEFHHIRQYHTDSDFILLYVGSSAKRARYEARADHVYMEMYYWQRERLVSPTALAAKLPAYKVTKGDTKYFVKHLRICAAVVRQGEVRHNLISRQAQDFLKRRARRRSRRRTLKAA